LLSGPLAYHAAECLCYYSVRPSFEVEEQNFVLRC